MWEPAYWSMGPDYKLDDDDPWFVFAYDERWRMVATFRGRTLYESRSEPPVGLIEEIKRAYLDAVPWSSSKEVFYNH